MRMRIVFGVLCAACAASVAVVAQPALAAPAPPYQALTVESPTPQAHTVFGEVMHTVGDIDHDGVKEVIATAGTTVKGVPGVGRVWVLDGRTGAVLLTLDDPQPQPQAGFGSSITGLGDVNGDVNGDGVPDIAVGAPFQSVYSGSGPKCDQPKPNGCNENQGEMYVFSGKDGHLLYSVNDPRPQPNAYFGALFVTALSEHGAADVAAAAPGEDVNGVPGAGAAYVFAGKNGSVIRRIPNPHPETSQASGESYFSMGLSNPGDVDGDHVDDLVVGFAGTTVGGNIDQGRAYLFDPSTGKQLRAFDDPVPQVNADFGSMYSDPYAPGDVNGDGVPDIYVDADGQTVDGVPNAGQAYIFSGRDGRLLRTLKSPRPVNSGFFGFIFSPAGDLYRNGEPDLLVGQTGAAHMAGAYAPGGAWVFDPRTGNVLADFTNIAPDAGQGIASPGDVNGDGVPDYLLAAPRTDVGDNARQGRAFLVLSVPGAQPSLDARVTRRRARRRTSFTTSGRVLLPAPVSRSACEGLVSIEIEHGSKALSRRRVAVKADCTYRQTVSILNSRLRGRGRDQIIVRFLGNYLLKPARARARFA